MNTEKLSILGVFAAIGLLVLAVPLLQRGAGEGARATDTSTGTFAPRPLAVQQRGIWLQIHNNHPGCPFEQYVEEIIATGANTVCFTVSGEQENGSSTSIYIDSRRTPSDQRLTKLIAQAKRRGLRVVFMPIVLLTRPVGDEWRGQINPDSWDDWWTSYTRFILEYAALCQESGVDVFMVGSELIKTEKQEDRWRELIAKVRKQGASIIDRQFREHLRDLHPDWTAAQFRSELGITDLGTFAGSTADLAAVSVELVATYESFTAQRRMRLSYSANWDHYTVPKFWDALDAVGMTTYYNLNRARRDNPSLESLLAAWKPIREKIAAWQRTVNRPIFFTEVGWASQDGCSIEPWNYYHSKELDLVEQRRCMQSFLQTFGDEPWVGGILIWKWRDHPQMTGKLDIHDDGRLNYTPFGKPVLDDLRAFFAAPDPIAASRPAERTAKGLKDVNGN